MGADPEWTPQTWELERASPVRADAESIFVPAADLPEAALGDTVVVTSHEGGETRTATIIDTSQRHGAPFFRLELRTP